MWTGIIAVLVILGGVTWAAISQNKPADKMMSSEEKMMNQDKKMTPEKEMAMQNDKMAMDKDAMMKKDSPTPTTDTQDAMMKKEATMEKDAMMIKKEGAYKEYSPETVTSEQAAGQKIVLFFHAGWCPSCKAADTAFKTNLEKIPAGVTVLKTDYDNNKELKTKYGITTQHTFVQIDTSGNMVTKWVSGDVDMLVKNIK